MAITQQHSSLSSFMSGLLKENIKKLEDRDDRVSVHIVEDNAKALEFQLPLRCRSLVSMERRRSPKPDCRWSSGNNGSSNKLSSRSNPQPRRGSNTAPAERTLRTSTSDTELLRIPQRHTSPRITKGTVAPLSSKSSPNATWNQSVPQKKKINLFDSFLQLSSPEEHAEVKRSRRPTRTLTPPCNALATPLTRPSNTKMAVKSHRGVSQFNPSEQQCHVKKSSLPRQKVETAMFGVPMPPQQHMTGAVRPPRQNPAA
eukprot:Nitzschia sp. Nitz4//scaffold90_size81538//44582//45352//NITZ4_005322-RA/size81538-exonerate_est2genome-gene-0.19-mRNA-1//1//CDS//3329560020//7604//frame0